MKACTRVLVWKGEMTVLFLRASRAESPTKERTHREERTLRPVERSQHRYPRQWAGEGESHTPESWLCSQGRALRNTATDGSGACIHRGCVPARVCARAPSTPMRVPVCLFPPPPLPPSVLKHAPRPKLLGQLEPKVPDRGWGGCAKGDPVLPTLANWGHRAPYLGH